MLYHSFKIGAKFWQGAPFMSVPACVTLGAIDNVVTIGHIERRKQGVNVAQGANRCGALLAT
jgi:hypothetical protein